jgi:hypothetical protein
MPAAIPPEVDERTNFQPSDTPLDVNLLKEIARKALVDALNSVCLVWQFFDLFANARHL